MRGIIRGLIIMALNCLFFTFASANTKDRYITIREYTLNLDTNIDLDIMVKLDKSELRLLINGIYAKYGYDFKSTRYKDYFSKYSWYQPRYTNVENQITLADWRKINRYLKYEKDIEIDDLVWEQLVSIQGREYRIKLYKNAGIAHFQAHHILYNTIRIYDIENNEKLIFDTRKQGQIIDGGAFKEPSLYVVEDLNGDGIEEIYFKEVPLASSLQTMLIVTFANGEMKTVFYDPLYGLKYIDVDGDGVKEMYGSIIAGGQVSYNEGFRAVHVFHNDQYVPSYELTWKFETQLLAELETSLGRNSTLKNLDQLIRQYAYMGLYDEAKLAFKKYPKLMAEYQALIEKDPITNEGFYIQRLEPMVEDYKTMWSLVDWYDINKK